jgi:DoxX-like family
MSMSSKNFRRLYYTTLFIFSVAMIFSGIAGLSGQTQVVNSISQLGYPPYFTGYLSVCKLAGIVCLWLIPIRFLRDFAYTGFFIVLLSGIFSHLAAGDEVVKTLPLFILLQVIALHYYCFYKMEQQKQKNKYMMYLIHKKIKDNDPRFDMPDPYYDAC